LDFLRRRPDLVFETEEPAHFLQAQPAHFAETFGAVGFRVTPGANLDLGGAAALLKGLASGY
jgi:hypothetical protein